MAIRDQPPPAAAGGDDSPAAAGRDDSTEQALARSRGIREQVYRQIQAVREHMATARRQRSGLSAGSWPIAPDPAARPIGTGEQIERSRQARARLASLAAKLVQTEQAVARIQGEMAGRGSRRAAPDRRAAAPAPGRRVYRRPPPATDA